jgi:hypothetical protein
MEKLMEICNCRDSVKEGYCDICMEEVIAENMMTTEYLGALMQEPFIQEHIQVIPVGFNEDIDVTLDPIYSPQWSESAWVTKTTKEEE